MHKDKTLGPWTELGRVLAVRPKGVGAHPPKPILLAYLRKELPSKPIRWTTERIQAFLRGEIRGWTETEVRMHLALCTRCRRKVLQLQTAPSPRPSAHWRKRLANPHLGWALAGAQALALAGVLLWFALSPSPAPSSKPEFFLPSEFAQSEWVNARLVPNPETPVAQLNAALQTYGIVIVSGPDEEGGYIVVGKEEALREILATEVVESIILKGR